MADELLVFSSRYRVSCKTCGLSRRYSDGTFLPMDDPAPDEGNRDA